MSRTSPTLETRDDSALPLDAVAAEYLRRQRARQSLIEYSQAIDIPGAPLSSEDATELFKPVEQRVALHHRVIMDALQWAMEPGKGRRLMIMAPPGSAKSTYASVIAPSWAMGKWPGHRIILASYATGIASKQSRKARAICRQKRYTRIWGENPQLLDDQRAVDEWSLTNGSEFMAAGMLAGITGNRANGLVIDDPLANREQADSPTIREKIYAEYTDTATTRLIPGGYIVLITTRWHENDLAGEILPEGYNGESGDIQGRDGQVWRVLCIPAEAEREDDVLGRKPGEFLWPEWFPATHWNMWRNNPRNARTWSSMFQQRPAPLVGVHFKHDMFRWYDPAKAPGDGPDALPANLRVYGASDYATLDGDGDWTEHGVVGLNHEGHMYFVDWWSGQKESDVTIDKFIDLVAIHKPVRWWDEGGVIDKAIGPAKRKRMAERQKYVSIEALPSMQDKASKLQSFHARCTAKTVWFPLRRRWAQEVVEQLIKFPAGKHDDKADVCGLLGRGIEHMVDAHVPMAQNRPQLVPFTGKWLEFNDGKDKPKVRYF